MQSQEIEVFLNVTSCLVQEPNVSNFNCETSNEVLLLKTGVCKQTCFKHVFLPLYQNW